MIQAENPFLQQLAIYKKVIDHEVGQWCEHLLKQSEAEYTSYSRVVAEAYCSILQRGGKRLRGALVMNAYSMVGGNDTAISVRAACVMELLHASLLIFDDIADRSVMRRGGPAAHVWLTEQHRLQNLHGESQHFGVSQAINAGLLGQYEAQVLLTQLAASDTIKLEAIHDINYLLSTTTQGQINDIYNQAVRTVSEAQVEKALDWKTSYYTFLAPLKLGALLARATIEETTLLEDYSREMGLAFQITDDILGTFGNSFESGKSAQDDIKEGKITLLVSRALERASPAQREKLLSCLGNQQLTPPDHEACRQIIEETGALDYARKRAQQCIVKAIATLDNAPTTWSSEGVAFLRDLSAFVAERHS